jgi:hypothetical protein
MGGMARRELKRRIEALDAELRRRFQNQSSIKDPRVQEATRDAYVWVTQYTNSYNPHWLDEGRVSAYEPFPQYVYIDSLFRILDLDERIIWFEKSRDMMLSWCCVAYFTRQAMTVPEREVLFQTQKEDKAKQLVRYAKTLYDMQPEWLKAAYPLTKSVWAQPELELHFANGGSIVGIPGGADQIRSYHPWGYLLDEASFVTEAGECYNEALSAVRGKIILNSSAGPGWYADARRDIVRSQEE